MEKVAIFGGSFNPPGIHHEAIAWALSTCGHFERVVIALSGPYQGKEQNCNFLNIRMELASLAFGRIPGVVVDYYDLENETFTSTIDLLEQYCDSIRCNQRLGFSIVNSEIWFVVGMDLIIGGKEGVSEIQKFWAEGKHLFQEENFVVLNRPGYEIKEADVPPHCLKLFDLKIPRGSSTQIRECVQNRIPISDLVSSEVEQCIYDYNLTFE